MPDNNTEDYDFYKDLDFGQFGINPLDAFDQLMNIAGLHGHIREQAEAMAKQIQNAEFGSTILVDIESVEMVPVAETVLEQMDSVIQQKDLKIAVTENTYRLAARASNNMDSKGGLLEFPSHKFDNNKGFGK